MKKHKLNNLEFAMKKNNKITKINGKKPFRMVRSTNIELAEVNYAYYAMISIGLAEIVVKHSSERVCVTTARVYRTRYDVSRALESLCEMVIMLNISDKQYNRFINMCEDYDTWITNKDVCP